MLAAILKTKQLMIVAGCWISCSSNELQFDRVDAQYNSFLLFMADKSTQANLMSKLMVIGGGREHS